MTRKLSNNMSRKSLEKWLENYLIRCLENL